jgi:hypothetical protein
MLQKLSHFFRIPAKTSLISPDLHYQFNFFSLAFFSSRNFKEQKKSQRVIFDEKLLHVFSFLSNFSRTQKHPADEKTERIGLKIFLAIKIKFSRFSHRLNASVCARNFEREKKHA